MTFVLDTSIALAWCFEDEQTPAVMNLLDRVVETGAVAPLLWPLETLNGLLMAERRRRIDAAKRETLTSFLHDLPIELDPNTAQKAWDTTRLLAERHRLTVHDAAYLELAARLRLPLATLDQALRDAAEAVGLPTLGT